MIGIEYVATYLYSLVGLALAMYWFTKYYERDYKKSIEDEEPKEKGMVSFILLVMTILWPIIVIKNIILHKTL